MLMLHTHEMDWFIIKRAGILVISSKNTGPKHQKDFLLLPMVTSQ